MTAAYEAEFAADVPQHDRDAELAVLAACLVSEDVLFEVAEILRPADFYLPAHTVVFDAMLDLAGLETPVDAVNLAGHLDRRGDLARIGGAPYLHTIVSALTTTAAAPWHARIVRDKAERRRLEAAGVRIAALGRTFAGDTAEAIDAAQAELLNVALRRADDEIVRVGELTLPTLEMFERIAAGDSVGLRSGFRDLDELTNGFHPGQMITVAGRPAMGKSTWAMDALRHAAITEGKPAVMFSLEMGRDELMMRIFAAEASVQLQSIRSGTLSDADWLRLMQARERIDAAPLFLMEAATMSVFDFRRTARRIMARHGLSLIVVDYLQLASSGRKTENQQAEVSAVARSLKLLATELKVPVIAVSQLNRSVESRGDKRPQLSDLRDSGAVEQDSDMVILLTREDYYDKNSPRSGECDMLVAKNRSGPTRDLVLAFQGHYSRFANLYSGPS